MGKNVTISKKGKICVMVSKIDKNGKKLVKIGFGKQQLFGKKIKSGKKFLT